MRETIHEGEGELRVFLDAEMSKMSPEQRVALASLNEEAKKRLAEIAAFDAAKEEEVERKTVVDTPFTDVTLPGVKAETEASRKALLDQLDRSGLGNHSIQTTNSLRYTQATLADEFHRVFKEEIMALRDAGQKEYAHDDSSPFANFERGAKDMGIDRKQVLWCYAMKHKDGIAAALKGHTSQREDVRGRINDLIVYLLLLRGIYNEEVGSAKFGALGALSE